MMEVKFKVWDEACKKMRYSKVVSFETECGINYCVNDPEYPPSRMYTGLKDKNGVEIYDGDILKGHGTGIKRYIVAFTNGAFDLYHQFSRWGLLSRMFEINHISVEIIGNIHENPELV